MDHPEWHDIDDEWVLVTDHAFKTVKKSETLGDTELQKFHEFEIQASPYSVRFNSKLGEMMCVVFPIHREGRRVAHVLLAILVTQVTTYVVLLEQSIWVASLFLLVFAIGGALLLARGMLQPIRAIRETVGQMDLRNLDRRIKLVRTDSEMAGMVETLNGLFARLEKSYDEINDFSSNVAHELHTPLPS
jgi:signal transduction histidine kinase